MASQHGPDSLRAQLEAAILGLESEWMVFAKLALAVPPGQVRADYLLLHAARGAALLDLAPLDGDDPAATFRLLLERQRFAEFFPGELPIVHLVIEPEAAALLAERLAAAFAARPPLTLADPDWPDAVSALVTAQQAPRAWLDPPTQAGETVGPAAADAAFMIQSWAPPSPASERHDDPVLEPEPGPAPEPYIGPRLPRWQTGVAAMSLVVFAALFLSFPGEVPGRPPAVEVALAPALTLPPADNPAAPESAAPPPAGVAEAAPDEAPSPPDTPDRVATPSANPAPVEFAPAEPTPSQSEPPAPAAAPTGKSVTPDGEKMAVIEPPHPPPRRAVKRMPEPVAARPSVPPEGPSAAAVPTRAPHANAVAELVGRNCRTYASSVTVLGVPRDVTGLACQASDGTWQLVSEAPAGMR